MVWPWRKYAAGRCDNGQQTVVESLSLLCFYVWLISGRSQDHTYGLDWRLLKWHSGPHRPAGNYREHKCRVRLCARTWVESSQLHEPVCVNTEHAYSIWSPCLSVAIRPNLRTCFRALHTCCFCFPSVHIALIISIGPVDLVGPCTDKDCVPWEHCARQGNDHGWVSPQRYRPIFEKSNIRYLIWELHYSNIHYSIREWNHSSIPTPLIYISTNTGL